MQASSQIAKFVTEAELQDPNDKGEALLVPDENRFLLKFSQRLVWHFVIENPALASQQRGQRAIIVKLFDAYYEAVKQAAAGGGRDIVPARYDNELAAAGPDTVLQIRLVVDIICSLTDSQAVTLYRRLMGTSPGSVTDIL